MRNSWTVTALRKRVDAERTRLNNTRNLSLLRLSDENAYQKRLATVSKRIYHILNAASEQIDYEEVKRSNKNGKYRPDPLLKQSPEEYQTFRGKSSHERKMYRKGNI